MLRNFGSTETHLEQITQAMLGNGAPSPKATIAPFIPAESRTSTPLREFQDEVDAALEPQRRHESDEQYLRHSTAAVRWADRTAAAFAPHGGYEHTAPIPSASAAHLAKTARFEDMASISTAPIHPFQRYLGENSGERAPPGQANSEFSHTVSAFTTRTVGAKQLPFFHEKEAIIRAVVEREGHLSGAALDWFILNISKTQVAGRYPMGFADVLCALLGRFITSMNVQRATRSFDAVHFDNIKGPEAFAELLITRANQMHNIPEEFVVRQHFLSGLPATIRYKMKVNRESSPEYSSLEELRTAACHFWSTMCAEEVAGTPLTRDTAVATKTAATVPGRRAPITPCPPFPANPGLTNTVRTVPAGASQRAAKPATAAGVQAQRVLDSYAEGEESPDDDMFEGQGEDVGLGEGLWGGAQYDPGDEEDEPELGPNLADLGQDTRVGAMQACYYALRIPEPDSDEGDDVFVDAE
ncbi:hypothetical protein C8R43DRAFT_1122714 [Mycena crocata]|nr:hypothetical protein C8R43DRAFT_1122714 [Mycena crocata]